MARLSAMVDITVRTPELDSAKVRRAKESSWTLPSTSLLAHTDFSDAVGDHPLSDTQQCTHPHTRAHARHTHTRTC
jgi:hypothetical protein